MTQLPYFVQTQTSIGIDCALGGYVRMSIADRREAVKELAGEGMSNVAIGKVLGVDEGTVRNAKRSENSEVDSDEASNRAIRGLTSSENSEPLSAVAVLAADDKIRTAARTSARPDLEANALVSPVLAAVGTCR